VEKVTIEKNVDHLAWRLYRGGVVRILYEDAHARIDPIAIAEGLAIVPQSRCELVSGVRRALAGMRADDLGDGFSGRTVALSASVELTECPTDGVTGFLIGTCEAQALDLAVNELCFEFDGLCGILEKLRGAQLVKRESQSVRADESARA
jgi:hypothetical protein